MQANIFNIQRFSLHDGSGIRTLVFFKGCPLRCLWCSNPESQVTHPQLMFSQAPCIHCGTCMAVCPLGLIRLSDGGIRMQRERCTNCGKCTAVCPTNALRIAGKRLAVDELVRIVMQDRLFYTQSAGGVTLSGGEPFMQGECCRIFLETLKQAGIHTAVETCGFVSKKTLDKVLPFVDQFLFDVKLCNRKKHELFTGSGNTMILSNLRRLRGEGAAIVLRLPLIPGINMDLEHYDGVIRLINELGIQSVDLLAFHHYGKNKYAELGLPYQLSGVFPPGEGILHSIRQYLSQYTDAKIF